MNLNIKISLSFLACLCLTGVAQGRPNYAINNGNNCSACHTSSVTERMEVFGQDVLTDLVIHLDGQVRGPLKTFRVVPGQVVTLPIRVLDGMDRFAVQVKGFEQPAQRNDVRHRLKWSPANGDDNGWTRQENTNPPYFTKDNGNNGGLLGSSDSAIYTFDLRVEQDTPLDMYELVASVPGVRDGVKVYQEERFYLEVLSRHDLDGDSKVDCSDLCVLVSQWHKDYPRFDFSPMPEGDGIVDAQDLVVLSDHLFEDYRLIAHWTLDEAEGPFAFDTIDNRVGFVVGAPDWQPDGGQTDGALLLSGSGNYLRLPFVSNLAVRPFSVFAWVKGGGVGQVVLSQDNAKNWLMADPQTGVLMTELVGLGSLQDALVSETVITDDIWHHVGLVWDGTQTILYVDDVEVARGDAAESMVTSQGFSLGAGATQSLGGAWTGLADDVRFYDRAIVPQCGSAVHSDVCH